MRVSLIAAMVFALDRWTKWLVEARLNPYESYTVVPGFFNIVRSHNPGVAFGIFANSPAPYRTALLIAFSVAALGLLAWLLWRNRRFDPIAGTAIALIFGGAAGNVFDRVRAGMVTDFLDFYSGAYHWYTFNIADAAISTGAALLLLDMWLRSRRQQRGGAPA